jgi:CheY-like chemotaxis protein
MPHRLLLADDSVTIQKVIELTFADEDVSVVAVSDGDQAIARLEAESFDIVLADIGMPGKDGFEVASYLAGRPPSARIPVILLTGAFEPVDNVRVQEAGASAVLAKPFEPQVLVAKVRELLKATAGPTAAGAGQSAEPSTSDRPWSPSAATAPKSPSVDDYFERLDRAFANLNAPLEPREFVRELVMDSEPAAAPVVSPEHRGGSMEQLQASPTPSHAADSTAAPPGSPETAVPRGAGGPGGLAQSFATLLAVEQGELPPSALVPPSSSSEDELVDRIARRVVEQMGDHAVRELTADIVSRTAERLVREEIERIKARVEGD